MEPVYNLNNTIHEELQIKQEDDNKYKLKCIHCHRICIGQTGGNFRAKYKEHFHNIRHSEENQKYAKHL
jgi:hypothetical protein